MNGSSWTRRAIAALAAALLGFVLRPSLGARDTGRAEDALSPSAVAEAWRQVVTSSSTPDARRSGRGQHERDAVPTGEDDMAENNAAVRADRARQIFELRLAGHSMAHIADVLGTSQPAAYREMSKWIKDLLTPKAFELRTVEQARLERLLVALDPAVQNGDIAAIKTAAGISGQLADLLGIKAPVQVEHKVRVLDAVDEELMRLSSELVDRRRVVEP